MSIVLAGIALGCLIAAGVIYLNGREEDARSEEIFEALKPRPLEPSSQEADSQQPTQEAADKQTEQSTEQPSSEQAEESPKESQEKPTQSDTAPEAPVPIANPYADSYQANADMAAWLQIPDTVIDYPVMWTPWDENYYLYRDFNKAQNQNGCLILDTDSCVAPMTTNLIIHGHNMKSGAMFGSLLQYEKKDYYEKHKQIILHTPQQQHIYEVIAVFRSQVYRKSDQVFKFYQFFQADTEEEFLDFYNNIKALSQYDTGVTANFGDHFITLSTCVYHVENGRLVVVAKEIEGGDSYLPLE